MLVEPAVAGLLANPNSPAEVDEPALLLALGLLALEGLGVVERDDNRRRLNLLDRRLVSWREGKEVLAGLQT